MQEVTETAVQIKPEYIVGLSILATAGLVMMWGGAGTRWLSLRKV